MAMHGEPARGIWEVNEHLEAEDPRWVDTEAARGDYSWTRFCRTLGVDRAERRLVAPDRGYYLFCGQRGYGKSTELRRISRDLHHADLYYVVLADATQELDVNRLRYQAARQEVTDSGAPAVVDASLQHFAPVCGTLRSATESRSAGGWADAD